MKTSLKHFISMIDSLRLTDRSFRVEESLPTPSMKSVYLQKCKTIKKKKHINKMITFFVCLLLFFSFSFVKFFSFKMTKKKKNNKNRVLPEISPIILWPQFFVF